MELPVRNSTNRLCLCLFVSTNINHFIFVDGFKTTSVPGEAHYR